MVCQQAWLVTHLLVSKWKTAGNRKVCTRVAATSRVSPPLSPALSLSVCALDDTNSTSIRVLDTATGSKLHKFTGHASNVQCLAASSDSVRTPPSHANAATTPCLTLLPRPHSASWSPALTTGILASGTRHTRVTARCRGRAWLCVAVGQCHCRLRPAPRICMCWRCWTRARRACGGARSPPAASPASTDPASPRASFAPRARAPLAAHNPTSEQHRCSWTLAVAAAAARCASWRKALVSLSSTTYGTLVKTGNGAPRWPWTLQWKRVVRWRSRLQAKHLGR